MGLVLSKHQLLLVQLLLMQVAAFKQLQRRLCMLAAAVTLWKRLTHAKEQNWERLRAQQMQRLQRMVCHQ
jgi:hypothetical protein